MNLNYIHNIEEEKEGTTANVFVVSFTVFEEHFHTYITLHG